MMYAICGAGIGQRGFVVWVVIVVPAGLLRAQSNDGRRISFPYASG
jgi:hypothetical protein